MHPTKALAADSDGHILAQHPHSLVEGMQHSVWLFGSTTIMVYRVGWGQCLVFPFTERPANHLLITYPNLQHMQHMHMLLMLLTGGGVSHAVELNPMQLTRKSHSLARHLQIPRHVLLQLSCPRRQVQALEAHKSLCCTSCTLSHDFNAFARQSLCYTSLTHSHKPNACGTGSWPTLKSWQRITHRRLWCMWQRVTPRRLRCMWQRITHNFSACDRGSLTLCHDFYARGRGHARVQSDPVANSTTDWLR
eukprot:1160610-Pelagomonas_calceolata.AAC.7